MSLTTVAAAVQPDEELARLPASHPERFLRSDFIAAGLVFLITLGVYIATLAPNVTLEDSGELITAAATLGVGHPPGYPLWTMSGFLLSHLLPFGNMAWKMNLLDALFGAASNAVLALLVCHSGRWLLQRWTGEEAQPVVRRFSFYTGLFAGLTIGFSEVMWSQAVIAAVHGTLNALFMNLVLILFYFWMIAPEKKYRLVLTVFVFSLGLTNHHTLVQIIPAFLFAALLLRGQFWSVFLAVNLFSLSILVYVSWLSGDEQLQTICQVMARLIFILTAGVSFFYMKEFRAKLFLLGVATTVAIFAYGYFLMGPDKSEVDRFFHADVGDTMLKPALNDGKVFQATDETAALRQHISGWQFWQWGTYQHPGWLQGRVANARADAPPQLDNQPLPPRPVNVTYLLVMFALAALALGLLYTSTLDRRLIIGIFAAGWIGLVPYSYERFAASTHPPINWGYAADREGFFYEVSRVQYPKALPVLIKSTFGKIIGVVPKNAQLDPTIGLPDYLPRLGLSFYFYGDSLQSNFTVPLIFLTLAVLTYFRRFDWPQIRWFIFLGVAFFFVGFMLNLIAPPDAFDFQRNLSNKVFHLQSHCIFVILMSYGALAGLTYLNSAMPEILSRVGVAGFGLPVLCLSLLPLWSNFDRCSQAGHWFGYNFGADILRPLEKNAVYLGGSDPGRFVPTYMTFVESQQPDAWKRDPAFDRRDITVITQNALCDSHYNKYIRDQYDPRYRPDPDASGPAALETPDGPRPGSYTPFEKWLGRDRAYPKTPVLCESDAELQKIWDDYRHRPDIAPRIGPEGVLMGESMSDVSEVNALVTKDIFEKNKKDHTFYIEQCIPMEWTYPYLLPSGLILKFNPESMTADQFTAKADLAADHHFWDDYSSRLLSDPKFLADPNACLTFAKLAYWHADLYRYRQLEKEQEYWLRLTLRLCPQFPSAVFALTDLLIHQQRFDEATAVVSQAIASDPFSDDFARLSSDVEAQKSFDHREIDLKSQLALSPNDVDLNLNLARVLQDEAKYKDLDDRLRTVATMTNWTDQAISNLLQDYVEKYHNFDAAAAFLEARSKVDPKNGKLLYSLATLKAQLSQPDDAIKYLTQSIQDDTTNALGAARVDTRFAPIRNDPRFIALIAPTALPATNAAPLKPATPDKKSPKQPKK